jgi:lysophospholipase L1-like esterase
MRIATSLARTASLLGLAVGSVLLSLVAFEGGLRLVRGDDRNALADAMADLFVVSDDEKIVYEHAPLARVTFPASDSAAGSSPAWHVTTNESGLRRNGDEVGAMPDLRGICLGDSIMFGAGLDDDQTIPARISAAVSQKLGRRFECLNFGVSNYTTVQEVDFFRYRNGLSHAPVIVVLEIFTNDFKTGPGEIRIRGGHVDLIAADAATWLDGFWSSLRLADLVGSAAAWFTDVLRGLGLRPPPNGKPLRPEETAALYAALDDLRALLATKDVPLLVVFFPRAWQLAARDRAAATERQRVVAQYCERHGVPYVDLLDHFYGQPNETYFRPGDDAHPHASAARRIAEIIAESVVGILPGSAAQAAGRAR